MQPCKHESIKAAIFPSHPHHVTDGQSSTVHSEHQTNNVRSLNPKLKKHFFERLSVTLQKENEALLLERSPHCSAANINGEL